MAMIGSSYNEDIDDDPMAGMMSKHFRQTLEEFSEEGTGLFSSYRENTNGDSSEESTGS